MLKSKSVLKTLEDWGHALAASIFLLFSVSIFIDLLIRDVFHGSINPVFTFLSNRFVLFIGGAIELFAAIYCIKNRGRQLTNIVILTYVSLILWYRWAFYYNGGHQCNCAGILGIIFHISKTNEKMIPVIALIILTGTTVPWLIFHTVDFMIRLKNKATVIILMLLIFRLGNAAQIIEIYGSYSAARYNPRTGAIYLPPLDAIGPITNDFKATICGTEVSIYVTNHNDRAWWAEFIYDGTNSFTLNSYDFRSINTNYLKPQIEAYAAVSPTPYLISDVADKIGISVPWLTYGLQPSLLNSNKNGVVEIPLPWMASRQDLFAFGYRWNVTPTSDGRFADHLSAIRDQSLDLSDEQELLRPEVRYPTGDLGMRNLLLQKVKIRKQIPTGFPGGSYECTKWWNTNGVAIPLESNFKYFWKGYSDRPTYEAFLKANSVQVRQIANSSFMPVTEQATLVHDYRFRQVRMPRIYEWAEYTNRPGETWRSLNDPYILSAIDSYFKNGPRYDSFGGENRRFVSIVIFALILLPLMGFFVAHKKRKHKQN